MGLAAPPGARATVTPIRPTSGPAWHALCPTSKGRPIANLVSVLIALRNDPHWANKLRYDEMLCSVVLTDGPAEDIDAYRIHEWMQDNGLTRVGLEVVREAIEIVGREHPFHPVRDWLSGLQWDGDPRLGLWVRDYLGADDSAYHSEIGQKFLIALVARIFQPGCKSDYMPVLEGPQRTLKSTVCRLLVGDRYFSDNLPDLGTDHVRVSMHLRGRWLIEISELSAFSRADAAKLKAFLSSPVEQFTPKHARKPVEEPRQCLFIGTTNDKHYLRDATGGSRYWPIVCGQIDLEGLARDREQLFAEAVHHYQLKTPWWPDPKFEIDVIKPIQDERFEADAWDEAVLAYLFPRTRTTLAETAQDALDIPKNRLGTSEQRRLATLMRSAGWVQHKGTGGARYWTKIIVAPVAAVAPSP